MADTGWLDHGTFYDDDYGPGNPPWVDLTNAVSENDSYSSVAITGEDETDFLRGQNIDEAIPAGSTVNGIEVRVKGYHGGVPLAFLLIMQLHLDGATTGDDESSFELVPGSNGWIATIGGPANMWGTSLDLADIKDPTFGVKFVIGTVDTQTLYVDCVQMKIYYDEPSGHRPLPPHFKIP